MNDDTPNFWGTAPRRPDPEPLTLEKLREAIELVPAPLVLMVMPMERGRVYYEKHPGAVLKMKERVRVAFIHKDDVQTVQAARADAGLPPFRIVTADDMAPWEPPPLTHWKMPLGYGNLGPSR
jgi:hypothetical protein